MQLTTDFKHVEDDGELGCQVLELPYQGEELSMVILLPFDTYGLTKVEESVTHDKLQGALALTQSCHSDKVEVYLPRFKMTQQFQLNGILAKMGSRDLFDEFKADFSGISPGPERLYVSLVIHKAFVEVNEKGTEAAAATAVVIKARSAAVRIPPKLPVFRAAPPFLFMICHKKSGGILFMGRMVRPESS